MFFFYDADEKMNKMLKTAQKMCILCRRCYSDVLPTSEIKVIKQEKYVNDKNQALSNSNLQEVKMEECANSKEFRVNDVNIQMISKNIYDQLFKGPASNVSLDVIKSCQAELQRHGIDFRSTTHTADVQLKLPQLEGRDIEEHFYNIGSKQSAAYKELLKGLATCMLPALPKEWLKHKGWSRYTADGAEAVAYPPDDALILDVEVLMTAGKRPTLACAVSPEAWYGWVSEPLASSEGHQQYDSVRYEDLIPLETDGSEQFEPEPRLSRPRVVVGHNVAYDRAKIREQYWLNKTGVRFMDTMSMHTCVSGVTSYQRTVLKAKSKEPHPSDGDWMEVSSLNSLTDVHKLYCGVAIDKQTRDMFVQGALEDVRDNFQRLMKYCAGDVIATHNVLRELLPLFLQRFPHPATLAGMLELGSAYLPVNSNWQQYIDSAETVFEDLKLESRQILSAKADEACRLMENRAYRDDLWMWDQDWSTQTLKLKKSVAKSKKKEKCNIDKGFSENYVAKSEKTSRKFDVLSEEYIESLKVRGDLVQDVEELGEQFEYLYALGKSLPVKRPQLAGYPAWYRKLCAKPTTQPGWTPGANSVTTSMQITPKLLRLSWEGYPLHYLQTEGWGFLVPYSRTQDDPKGEPAVPLHKLLQTCPLLSCKHNEFEADIHMLPNTVEEDLGRRAYYARKTRDEQAAANQYHGLGVWCGVQVQGCCHFLRLPHKDGPKYKVGNPLAKDFLNMFSQNVLSAQGNDAEKVLSFGRMMSYWRNNRERVTGQQVVWLPERLLPERLRRSARRYGAIVPQVVVCGTLTRRASEPTWMTASNAHAERVGSELRAMVQAPPGYKFVGADVDSQELWIAALLGDSGVGLCGGSAFGWAVLAGDKRRGTDLHSLTARAADIHRDHAKVINYARIYGAGQNFAERLLKQFNPTMTISEAKSKAAKMFSTTKGRRVYRLKTKYMEGFMDEESGEQPLEMSGYQATRLAKLSGKRLEDMFERGAWLGGTESHMFNKLEEIAGRSSYVCRSIQPLAMSGYQATRLAKLSGKRLEDMFERGAWLGGTESHMFNKLEEIAGRSSYVCRSIQPLAMSGYQATRLAKLSGKRLEDMFERGAWLGGTESHMFNKLEEIAGRSSYVCRSIQPLAMSGYQATRLAKLSGKRLEDMFERGAWLGGTESHMFNKLEEIAGRSSYVCRSIQPLEMSGYQATRLAKLSGKRLEDMFERGAWLGGTESHMFNKLEEIAGRSSYVCRSIQPLAMSGYQATRLAKLSGKRLEDMFERGAWLGGTESHMFNKLEEIAGRSSYVCRSIQPLEMSGYQATRLAKLSGKRLEDMFERGAWLGGTESHMFNKLEEIAGRSSYVCRSIQPLEMSGYQATRLAKLSGKRLEDMFERGAWLGGTESHMFNKLEEIAGRSSYVCRSIQPLAMSGYQATRLAKLSGKRLEDMFERGAWLGGTESHMFNKLEEIAGRSSYVCRSIQPLAMSGYQATRLAKLSGKRLEDMFERGAWLGGTESHMFNKLEEIAGRSSYVCRSIQPLAMSGYQATRLAKLSGKRLEDMFERGAWLGGTESHMFNKLEEIAGRSSYVCRSIQPLAMSGYQATRLAKLSGKRLEDMFERGAWLGGTESHMFNKLEEIADSELPATAFLSGRLSRALERAGGRWGGTRLNWAVQSAAADFLHLMLVSMAELAPTARFCLSFHDEVRYLVAERHSYRTALALQLTNLFTRAFCSQRVGIHDLPMSVAFFSSVEVDQVLRKEAALSCATPSNPHGLDKGYGIPSGESLTIFDVLDKCAANKSC
ncbi:DNA polymerase subunit gamma-1, mitochondrial [Maniola hyperantus]|uniref:DNA polymerase subunit gamma-1, mitochondrial n=1 Tax=Aphantopus hyperantus TaxID=2795564 RepID=UPI0037492BBC